MEIMFKAQNSFFTAHIAVLFAIIFTIILGINPVVHASSKNKNIKARISAVTDVKALAILTDKEYQAVALSSGRILHHVEEARQAIADGKKADAISHVDQGLKLVRIIENAVPKRKVVTDIKSGDTQYHHEEDISQRYVDIFDEQHVEDIITPILQVRKKSDAIKAEEKKDEPSAIVPLEDFSVYQHTSMKLDMVVARRMLEAAKKDLKEDMKEDADDDLFTLQDNGIAFSSYLVELPLAEAADNLKLAKIQLNEGLPEEALATLELASDDLKDYEAQTGESRALEVRRLHQEIDELTTSLKDEKKVKTGMGKIKERIGKWWDTTVKWMRK